MIKLGSRSRAWGNWIIEEDKSQDTRQSGTRECWVHHEGFGNLCAPSGAFKL